MSVESGHLVEAFARLRLDGSLVAIGDQGPRERISDGPDEVATMIPALPMSCVLTRGRWRTAAMSSTHA